MCRECGGVRCISASFFRHGPFCPIPLTCANLVLLTYFKAHATCFTRQVPGVSVFLYHTKTYFSVVPAFGTHLSLSLSSFFLCPDSGEGGHLLFVQKARGAVIIPKPLLESKPGLPQANSHPVQSKRLQSSKMT